MSKLRLLFLFLFLGYAPAMLAADFAGTWTAHIPCCKDGHAHVETMVLKVDGETVTGTITMPNHTAMEVSGAVAGDKITLKETFRFNATTTKVRLYTGTIGGDKINFSRHWDGEQSPMTFEATRQQ